MRGRPWNAVGITAASIVVVFVACTFPDVTFGRADLSPDSSLPTDATTAEANVDVTPTDGAPIIDATVRDDASQRIDASTCDASNCDCDGDHFARANCDAGNTPGILPGVDCDDYDRLRFPDAGYSEALPEGHDGDWNCDGHADKFYKPVNCTGLAATGCTGSVNGFQTDPPCGVAATFYTCGGGGGGLGCVPIPGNKTPQICK